VAGERFRISFTRSYPGQSQSAATKQQSRKRAKSAGGVTSNVRFEIAKADVTLIQSLLQACPAQTIQSSANSTKD